MENRLKERLTGAAILVALIVLVVPEIFRGPQSPAVDRSAGSNEGPPLRSLTIDLSGTASPTTPRAQGSSNPPNTLAPASAPAPSPPLTSTAARTATPAVAPAPAVSPTPARPTSTHGSASAPEAIRATSGPQPHGSREAHVVTKQAKNAQRTAGWSVQLGLFAKANNAQRLMHEAESKGFPAGVSRGSKGLYRVEIAGQLDRAAAEQLSRRLHAAGLPAAIMGPR